jgi:hypothetical protein
VPEGENLDRFALDRVVHVISDAREEEASNAFEIDIARSHPSVRLHGGEIEAALKLIGEERHGAPPVSPPPVCGFANLLFGARTDP